MGFIIGSPFIDKMSGKLSFFDFIEKMDLDGLTIVPARNREHINGNIYKDKWNIIWKL